MRHCCSDVGVSDTAGAAGEEERGEKRAQQTHTQALMSRAHEQDAQLGPRSPCSWPPPSRCISAVAAALTCELHLAVVCHSGSSGSGDKGNTHAWTFHTPVSLASAHRQPPPPHGPDSRKRTARNSGPAQQRCVLRTFRHGDCGSSSLRCQRVCEMCVLCCCCCCCWPSVRVALSLLLSFRFDSFLGNGRRVGAGARG